MSYSEIARLVDEMELFHRFMREETSDRAAALTAACFLEDSLRAMLPQYRDRPTTKPYTPPPKRSRRRAASFAALIVRTGEQELLPPTTQANLDAIRHIRNLFAHDFRARSFGNAAELCRALEGLDPWPVNVVDVADVSRERFLAASEDAVLQVRRLLMDRAEERHGQYTTARTRENEAELRRRLEESGDGA